MMDKAARHQFDIRLGKHIRACRRAAGVTQAKLADGLGMTFPQVQKYEEGVHRIAVSTLVAIAEILGTNVHSILGSLVNVDTEKNSAFRVAGMMLMLRGRYEAEGIDIERAVIALPRLCSAIDRFSAEVHPAIEEGTV